MTSGFGEGMGQKGANSSLGDSYRTRVTSGFGDIMGQKHDNTL